jgi:hypothetical protein
MGSGLTTLQPRFNFPENPWSFAFIRGSLFPVFPVILFGFGSSRLGDCHFSSAFFTGIVGHTAIMPRIPITGESSMPQAATPGMRMLGSDFRFQAAGGSRKPAQAKA